MRGARVDRRAAVAAALLLPALVLSACGDGSSSTPVSSSRAPTSDPVSSGTPTTTATTNEHAVERPGPFQAPLHTADILVLGRKTLTPAMVRQVRRLPGVTQVEQFSWAQASIEDHAVNVAAVDPSTYRNFNVDRVATFQPEWNRVAGGEMALRGSFRRQVSKKGYVRLGARADAPQVHVGAYSPQVPQVDAVVNETWIETLGMVPGNALLVSTGSSTPAHLRKPVQRIVGASASVQRVDIAARLGLDPHAVQNVVLVGSVGDAVGSYRYTVLGGGRIAPQASWVSSHISTRTMPIIGPMTCNTAMFPQLRAALDEIVADGLAGAIHPGQYAGCYVPRFIAGTTTLSNHAFGLAFDINVPENQRGTVGQIDRRVVAIFQKWGFTWGGTWHYTDPMHFELNRLVRPE
ncbi:MAG TPA: M15 family metallopeptidase [Nocardioides sp.]|nr:M15 family metallopeptidase [Nocardioides sp.]